MLTDFFMVKVLPTVRRKGTEETIEHRPGFFVKDIHALIHVLLEERQIDPEEQEILMGADDGQSSLKVSFRNYLFWEGLKKEKKVEFSTSLGGGSVTVIFHFLFFYIFFIKTAAFYQDTLFGLHCILYIF